MRIALLLLCSVVAPCLAATDTRVLRAGGDTLLRVEVVDVEDPARADMLHQWVAETAAATKTVSGRFPLAEAWVRVQQIDSRDSSPVPWGQTRRRGEAGVLLYVRRDAGYPALLGDWTAVHELSHLFHPYLGEDGRWLAEGLASYFQNALRARAGMLEADDAWERLDAGFRRGAAAIINDARLDAMGRGRGGTMRVYWAGAAYWLEADLALRRKGDSLDGVLDRYSRCCLRGTASVAPQDFIAALDRIAGGDALMMLYRRYAASRVFPSLDAAYGELGISRDAGGLRFSSETDAMRLRAAIMAPRAERDR